MAEITFLLTAVILKEFLFQNMQRLKGNSTMMNDYVTSAIFFVWIATIAGNEILFEVNSFSNLLPPSFTDIFVHPSFQA